MTGDGGRTESGVITCFGKWPSLSRSLSLSLVFSLSLSLGEVAGRGAAEGAETGVLECARGKEECYKKGLEGVTGSTSVDCQSK